MSAVDIPLADLRAQHAAIAAEVEDAVRQVMERGDFILGQDVESFEAEFARYCRVGLSFTGATPIWVGCDPETYCIDVMPRDVR